MVCGGGGDEESEEGHKAQHFILGTKSFRASSSRKLRKIQFNVPARSANGPIGLKKTFEIKLAPGKVEIGP